MDDPVDLIFAFFESLPTSIEDDIIRNTVAGASVLQSDLDSRPNFVPYLRKCEEFHAIQRVMAIAAIIEAGLHTWDILEEIGETGEDRKGVEAAERGQLRARDAEQALLEWRQLRDGPLSPRALQRRLMQSLL